jgi:plasmid maintenance system antidote protein VapI
MADMSGQELQEEFLSTVRKSQETVIEAIKTWVDTIQSLTHGLPSVQVPLADKLPSPEELVTSAYDFAEQLLASQRKFAEEVVKATTALLPGDGNGVPGEPPVR